jgi:predicted PP-loop superfamily ATPase
VGKLVRKKSRLHFAVKNGIITMPLVENVMIAECVRCANTTANPTITINDDGLCDICANYDRNFRLEDILKEREMFIQAKNEKVMVGLSGGKDSTATLYLTQKLGFKPTAFTFDIGYYPEHIFSRAAEVAKTFDVSQETIDIRPYITDRLRQSYGCTAVMYDKNRHIDTPKMFREMYFWGRRHYSVNDTTVTAFIRPCQLCRKVVIRAYYGEARKRDVKFIILGMNEWAGLSKNQFTAIRKLQPHLDQPAVYVVHLPYLLQHNINDTREILKEIGWNAPDGEVLVESNANSCLLARASETKAKTLLGFHPDTPRLSREATVGFITKDQAKKALAKDHDCDMTVRGLLSEAGIL